MGAAPAKFTFDLDLTRNQEHAAFISDAARTALMQQARAEGYAEGFAAGERSAASTAAQQLATAAATTSERAAVLLARVDGVSRQAQRDALDLAAGIARKLAAGLLARQPAVELEALLVDCLPSLEGVPHLVIRCHPDLADRLRDLAAGHIATSGFSGRLIVMGDPDIPLGDGRIEWADGGLVRDMAATSTEIDTRIAAYLAAPGIAASEETKP